MPLTDSLRGIFPAGSTAFFMFRQIYTHHMIRCAEASWYAWYRRLGTSVATGGGFIMLLAAAAVHDAASTPLLVIGGAWFAMGLASLVASRRYVREIIIDDRQVRLISARAQVDLDACDIIEVGHSRWDINRMGTLSIRTSTHGTIKAAARLTGLMDVLIALRQVNPRVAYRNL